MQRVSIEKQKKCSFVKMYTLSLFDELSIYHKHFHHFQSHIILFEACSTLNQCWSNVGSPSATLAKFTPALIQRLVLARTWISAANVDYSFDRGSNCTLLQVQPYYTAGTCTTYRLLHISHNSFAHVEQTVEITVWKCVISLLLSQQYNLIFLNKYHVIFIWAWCEHHILFAVILRCVI